MFETYELPGKEAPSPKRSISWKFIGVLLIFSLFVTGTLMYLNSSPKKTIDDKLSQLKELRLDKKARETIVEEQKKAIYTLDQKIIPLKCQIYSEVGAKDTWESECRDSFEDQQSKITTQVKEESASDYQ